MLDHRARVAKAKELLDSTVSPGSGIRTQADARSASAAAAVANLPPLVMPVDDVGQILSIHIRLLVQPEPYKRAWRHGRAWKMKIRAWKNQDPCFNFYKHYALLHKYPV